MGNPILRANENSPYLIQGPLVVFVDGEEQRPDQHTIALCRCGGSENKPYCDGTHRRNGFQGPQVEIQQPELVAVE